MCLEDDDEDLSTALPSFVVIEQEYNPHYQGFIGFIKPKDFQENDSAPEKARRRSSSVSRKPVLYDRKSRK